jgi:hypothetical protein
MDWAEARNAAQARDRQRMAIRICLFILEFGLSGHGAYSHPTPTDQMQPGALSMTESYTRSVQAADPNPENSGQGVLVFLWNIMW